MADQECLEINFLGTKDLVPLSLLVAKKSFPVPMAVIGFWSQKGNVPWDIRPAKEHKPGIVWV